MKQPIAWSQLYLSEHEVLQLNEALFKEQDKVKPAEPKIQHNKIASPAVGIEVQIQLLKGTKYMIDGTPVEVQRERGWHHGKKWNCTKLGEELPGAGLLVVRCTPGAIFNASSPCVSSDTDLRCIDL